MNMNQIVNMIMRMVMRRAVNFGVNAGINALSGVGRKPTQHNASGVDDFGNVAGEQTARSPQDKQLQQQASQTAQRTNKMVKATRRITKF